MLGGASQIRTPHPGRGITRRPYAGSGQSNRNRAGAPRICLEVVDGKAPEGWTLPVRLVFAALSLVVSITNASGQSVVPRIAVSDTGFVISGTGQPFTPWGFNYDRDWEYRLIEEYWEDDWAKVEEDFRELHALGANVVRICLQYHRFMDGPSAPNERNLSRLRDLVILAEEHGIYLDIVGLGSFRPEEDPAWYADLSEPERWAAQARFWETIARTLADRPGVFAFNLMNEPIVTGERLERGAWVHPEDIEGLHYVEYINLDPAGRDRADIAVAWVRQMKQAIRMHDRERPITVGMFPVLGLVDGSGFSPRRLAAELDFISAHLYPRAGRVDETLELLEGYDVGLPVFIEEAFPIDSSLDDYRTFLEGSRAIADGWMGFYWGETADDLRQRDEPLAALVLSATNVFEESRPR